MWVLRVNRLKWRFFWLLLVRRLLVVFQPQPRQAKDGIGLDIFCANLPNWSPTRRWSWQARRGCQAPPFCTVL